MNIIPNSKEEELLLRMFKHIKNIHFIDLANEHRLIKKSKLFNEAVHLEYNLIEDIANFIQNRFPEHYHSQRRKLETYSCLTSNKSE